MRKQEKATHCWIEAADQFLADKHNANTLNVLVYLQLL